METNKTDSKHVSIHINNGGVTMKIDERQFKDIHIPVLNIKATHMDEQTNQMKISLTPDFMREIGNWFIEEADDFEKNYEAIKRPEDRDPPHDWSGIFNTFKINNYYKKKFKYINK